jgi:hypothetical protein
MGAAPAGMGTAEPLPQGLSDGAGHASYLRGPPAVLVIGRWTDPTETPTPVLGKPRDASMSAPNALRMHSGAARGPLVASADTSAAQR